ncbi:galactoside alpha-(1,2)-fucosyltransferase 2-like [Mytilus trossulus]|uniref:galactoside alpha-(1,2)-fucosyltransferase 2-like n=1 Tax=Mytilus trossulus TaxID=6551 RepID=UPI0030047D2E
MDPRKWIKIYCWIIMERRKCIVIPCLTCAFVLIFFVFQTDVNKFPFFEVFENSMKNERTTKRNSTEHTSLSFKGNGNIPVLSKNVRNESTTKMFLKQTTLNLTTKGMTTSTINSTQSPLKQTKLNFTSKGMRISTTKGMTMSITKGMTISTTKGMTNSTTKGMTNSNTKGMTISDTKGMIISLTKGIIISTTNPAISAVRNNSNNITHFLCPNFMGGFGNMMFQLAAHFGVAKSKGMRVIVANNSELNRVFKLEDIDIRNNIDICKTFISRGEKQNCAYDKNILNFNNSQNIRLGQYLQSWKYFYDFRSQLRKQFTFRDLLLQEAKSKIFQTVKQFNIGSSRDVTLVGVHVRRGDMVTHKFGYNIATPEYLTKAVQYYKSKYKNVIFIIASQDIPWTKANMPNNTNVEYLNSPKREIIVATLSLCNHTITTVGSFSWWIGWLTGGEVTYFKWPAKEGSGLRKQYSKDFLDFYYPGWIGM